MLPTAHAQERPEARRFYTGVGSTVGSDHTQIVAFGLLVRAHAPRWLPRSAGPMSLHWDVSLGAWRAPRTEGGHRTFVHLFGMLVWRHTIGGQESRWFVDLGLGGGVFDHVYAAGPRRFSTAFQFTQTLGLGYRFGPGNAYEVSLRAQHVSNASIKKPNPGQNLVMLRLATNF